jgi:8-oxo-dGTP diphosphatase
LQSCLFPLYSSVVYHNLLNYKTMMIPKATAGAIIYRNVNASYEILLTKRDVNPFKDYWCLPGGHIDQYEPAEDAIIREVKEETDLDFSPLFLCYLDEIFPEMKLHNVVMMFYGQAAGIPKANPGEVSGIGWFSLEEAMKMDLAFCHNQALEIFLDKLDQLQS